MPGSSDFRLGADVVASDGRKVGSLVRVVVEREGFDARALVVKEEESLAGRVRSDESLFVTDEVVIPIAAVESATHDLVQLSINKGKAEIEIDRGENVMLGTSGHRLGQVHDVLYEQGELLGVVIKPDGFFRRDVVLPARFIERADDMALFARLEESDIEHLKPFVDAD